MSNSVSNSSPIRVTPIITPSRLSSLPSNTPTATATVVISNPISETLEISKIYKILVVGNAKCGKSSIISKYAYKGTMDSTYKTTIGADFVRKDVAVNLGTGLSFGVRLQLWDIAGQDRFQKLTRAYFNKAKGVVIVCDVSREGTIDAVKNWKTEIDNWSDQANCHDIPVVLFANKADLLSNPQDAFKTGAIMERICRELNFLGWWVTSAKTGENLDEGFNILINKIYENEVKLDGDIKPNSSFRDSLKPNGVIKLTLPEENSECYQDEDADNDIYLRPRQINGGDCC